MDRKNKWLIAGVSLTALMVAGCGTSSVSNQASPNTPSANSSSSVNSSSSTNSTATSALTLENLQFAATGLIVLTTHGNMNETLVNPHFSGSNSKQFIFTLRNVVPGKYSLNQPIPIQSNWASSMTIQQQGENLVFTCQLKPSISKFTSGIGAGDMLEFTFS